MQQRTLGFKPYGQERILETNLVQKVDFIKAWGQDPWAERAPKEFLYVKVDLQILGVGERIKLGLSFAFSKVLITSRQLSP